MGEGAHVYDAGFFNSETAARGVTNDSAEAAKGGEFCGGLSPIVFAG